ncbi:MAG: hypothetical protein AAF663_13305 [Planctomycetota bacterium]
MSKAGEKRQHRKTQNDQFSWVERAIGIGVGCFLGGLVGLMFGIGLACFGLTMWLWLVLPLTGVSIGAAIGWNFPFPLDDRESSEAEDPAV